jgi:hypothetical protein
MLRRLGVSLLIALAAAAVMGWLWRDDWPGPHPRSVARLNEHVAEWQTWREQRLPDNAAPVGSAADLMERLEQTDPPVSLLPMSLTQSIGEPLHIAGMTVEQAIEAVGQREGENAARAGYASASSLRVAWWESTPEANFIYASLDMGHLPKRWWSPQVLWYRLVKAPAGTSTAQAAEQLIVARLKENTVASPYWPDEAEPLLIESVHRNLVAQGIVRNNALATDLLWRMRIEALTFDLAIVGLIAGGLALLAQRAWANLRRSWRFKRGLCHACGYDLRASQARCPECGLTVPWERPELP